MSLPVTISLRPSRKLALLQLLAHAAAVSLLWPISLPLLYKGVLAAAIAASAASVLRRIQNPAVSALHLGKAGALEVVSKVGVGGTATVLPQTTILPGLIVLLLRQDGHTLRLCLPSDATAPQTHRDLRLWLKWQGGTG